MNKVGPCLQCGQEAPLADYGDEPVFFCCSCLLNLTGSVDPNCNCGVCEAERVRAQV